MLGRARRKFKERERPGVWKSKRWEEILIADDDGVHADRSTKTSGVCEELAAGQRNGWHPVGKDAETKALPWKQDDSCAAGGAQREVQTHLGGRRIDQGLGIGGERCEAVNLECKDNGESSGRGSMVVHRQA